MELSHFLARLALNGPMFIAERAALCFSKIFTFSPPQSELPYDRVYKMKLKCFNTVLQTFMNNYQTILNYFDNRSTNASAESFNAKVKAFRAQFRGVRDIPFFIFRLAKIFA